MAADPQDAPAAAAGLTEFATVNSTSVESHALKRKRAITPSGTNGDLEKQENALPFDVGERQGTLTPTPTAVQAEKEKEPTTFLYLAYGSNLAASTFKGVRGVRPLRAVNVHVPDLELTFDLPGIAYAEPCFANTRYRRRDSSAVKNVGEREYQGAQNLGWSKGLVGTVYEVTAADYKHIIETEGGGQGYADIQIPCYIIPQGTEAVPDPDSYPKGQTPHHGIPEKDGATTPFLAHTLLASRPFGNSRSVRKPGWAQPSPRYLGLIRTGSRENGLPVEYSQWLDSLQPYKRTTLRQMIGGTIFRNAWGPLILIIMKLGPLFSDKNGRAPDWFGVLLNSIFSFVWWTYDTVFYPLAGDGERTEGT